MVAPAAARKSNVIVRARVIITIVAITCRSLPQVVFLESTTSTGTVCILLLRLQWFIVHMIHDWKDGRLTDLHFPENIGYVSIDSSEEHRTNDKYSVPLRTVPGTEYYWLRMVDSRQQYMKDHHVCLILYDMIRAIHLLASYCSVYWGLSSVRRRPSSYRRIVVLHLVQYGDCYRYTRCSGSRSDRGNMHDTA